MSAQAKITYQSFIYVKRDHNKAGYVVALVSEFATKYRILPRQAYAYMKRFKGLVYFYKHYDVLHTFSFEDTIQSVAEVCRHNGGKIQ